jgi:polysaccharide biosynthesis/export protein
VAQAKTAIEVYLSQFLDNPEISLSVFAYNSKVYYIVTQGAGMGDQVFKFPITGNETVLDAIAQINGLNFNTSKRIWIARPTDEPGNVQMLPVQWDAITSQACATSNYQILPGDRVFVAEDKLVAFDTGLAKLTAPFERIMGFSMLTVGTVTRFSGPVLKGGGNANSSF